MERKIVIIISPKAASTSEGDIPKDASWTLCTCAILGAVLPGTFTKD